MILIKYKNVTYKLLKYSFIIFNHILSDICKTFYKENSISCMRYLQLECFNYIDENNHPF